MAMKPTRTLRSLLVKKRPAPSKTFGVVYVIKCSDCSWNYVGETGRSLQERQKEHSRAIRDMDVDRSEIARHAVETGHRVDPMAAAVVDKDSDWRRRVIKEAVWTKKLGGSNHVKHDIGAVW